MAPLRILLVDDFDAWRRAASALLQQNPDWSIVSEASNGVEAIRKTRELHPDLILLDVDLPEMNGIEAARQICAMAPDSKLLFLSELRYPDVVEETLRIGGRGYVLKSDAAHDLVPAVEAVMNGAQFVSSGLAASNPHQ